MLHGAVQRLAEQRMIIDDQKTGGFVRSIHLGRPARHLPPAVLPRFPLVSSDVYAPVKQPPACVQNWVRRVNLR